MNPVIDATGIHRVVRLPGGRQLRVLNGVDFSVSPGETVAIVGRSGSGKTTLLATLGLLTPVAEGQLWVLGQSAVAMSDRQRARLRNRHIGFVFQSYSLVRHLSAARNVELALRYGQPMRRRERQRKVSELLDLVGLSERSRSRPRLLSGGEQQRVAIARALVREPAVILADEPTGALDTDTAGKVLTVLLTSARERGTALVIVTHDAYVASHLERTVRMADGVLCGDE